MKKKLMAAGLAAALAVGVYSSAGADTVQAEEYVMILGTKTLMGKKVTISLDYGEQTKWLQDTRLKDDDGKVEKFNSMIDAMNHMSDSGGWVLHDAYAITVGNQLVYHWVLKRPRQ